jgi:hypothetical protein
METQLTEGDESHIIVEVPNQSSTVRTPFPREGLTKTVRLPALYVTLSQLRH